MWLTATRSDIIENRICIELHVLGKVNQFIYTLFNDYSHACPKFNNFIAKIDNELLQWVKNTFIAQYACRPLQVTLPLLVTLQDNMLTTTCKNKG